MHAARAHCRRAAVVVASADPEAPVHTVAMPTIAGIAAFGFLLMGQVGMALGSAAFVCLWFGIEALIGNAAEARRKRSDEKRPR